MRRFALISLGLMLLAVFAPIAARAQSLDPLVGARVRLEGKSAIAGRVTAVVIERRGDTLRVVPEHGTPLTLQLDQLSKLEISRGKSAAYGAQTGALWTGSIYGAFGAALALLAAGECETCVTVDVVPAIAYFALSGALLGATVGAIIGRERWERIDTHPRVSIQPIIGPRTGLRLSFSR